MEHELFIAYQALMEKYISTFEWLKERGVVSEETREKEYVERMKYLERCQQHEKLYGFDRRAEQEDHEMFVEFKPLMEKYKRDRERENEHRAIQKEASERTHELERIDRSVILKLFQQYAAQNDVFRLWALIEYVRAEGFFMGNIQIQIPIS